MSSPPKEPCLSGEEARAFREGVAQFNEGLFFECHDTLEDLWAGLRGPSRDFFQGLIQVSVAFYHLSRGNEAGAESLLRRALRRFEAYPDRYFGFDLAAHRLEIERCLDSILRGEGGSAPPRWRFEEAPLRE